MERVGFQQPPYTNSLEFLDVLREFTTDENAEKLFDDWLANITLYSNRVEEAVFTPLDGNRFLVDLKFVSRKVRCDGQGVETEVPLDDWVDIGIFGEETEGSGSEGEVLHLEKHHITGAETSLQLVVEGRPLRAGIDPYNKLVDRVSDDNTKKVQQAS